jgi:hypothetical protein
MSEYGRSDLCGRRRLPDGLVAETIRCTTTTRLEKRRWRSSPPRVVLHPIAADSGRRAIRLFKD